MTTRRRTLPAVLLPVCSLLIAMLCIQSGASLAKSLFPVIGALGTTAVRLVIAAVILFFMLRGWRARITRHNWTTLAIYGVTLAGMNLMFYLSVTRLPLGIAAAIEFMGPLTVSVVFSKTRRDLAWAGIAAIGLLLLLPLTGVSPGLDPIGICWALGAAVCWGLYIVYGQKAGSQHGTQTAALGMVIAALIALPFGVAEAGAGLLDVHLLPIALTVAVMSSAIPFTLEMFALRRLPARTFGTLMSIEPAIGALVGIVVLAEALSTTQWLAIALIVIASAGASMSASRSAEIASKE